MTTNNKMPEFRLLFLVTTPKLAQKAVDLFQEENVPVHCQFRAQGTASSEIMGMLGLGSIEKTVVMAMMPRDFAGEMLKKLRKRLCLGYANSGVAFTVAISGGNSWVKLIETLQSETDSDSAERKRAEMAESEYIMIMAIVNQGYSEEVMAVARSAGATGGTVFHSRQMNNEEAMQFFGISVQQEREVVLILAKKEIKLPMMKALGEQCGLQSEAHGIVLSLPVDGVAGLE